MWQQTRLGSKNRVEFAPASLPFVWIIPKIDSILLRFRTDFWLIFNN